MFQQIAAMGHERVLLCSNPEVGLKAIIAVHSTVLGPGLGGLRVPLCRCRPTISEIGAVRWLYDT